MGQPTVPVPPSLGGPEVVNRAMGSPKGRVDDPRTTSPMSRFSKSNASRTTALYTGPLGGICGRESADHMA